VRYKLCRYRIVDIMRLDTSTVLFLHDNKIGVDGVRFHIFERLMVHGNGPLFTYFGYDNFEREREREREREEC
jgi:hypothetical protein